MIATSHANSTPSAITAPTSSRDLQRYLPHLAAWRHAAGLTQLDLAGRAYVNKATISHLERGHRPATLELVNRLADTLGCEPWELIERAPAAEEGVIPTTCVQLLECPASDGTDAGAALPELLFYVPILWNPLERAISQATRTLDDAVRASERARIAAAVDLTPERLEAIAEGCEPVDYTTLQRLAALLGCPMTALIDWRGYTTSYVTSND